MEDKKNKSGVEEKKKTQGMRRDLGHKGCGRWGKVSGKSFLPSSTKVQEC